MRKKVFLFCFALFLSFPINAQRIEDIEDIDVSDSYNIQNSISTPLETAKLAKENQEIMSKLKINKLELTLLVGAEATVLGLGALAYNYSLNLNKALNRLAFEASGIKLRPMTQGWNGERIWEGYKVNYINKGKYAQVTRTMNKSVSGSRAVETTLSSKGSINVELGEAGQKMYKTIQKYKTIGKGVSIVATSAILVTVGIGVWEIFSETGEETVENIKKQDVERALTYDYKENELKDLSKLPNSVLAALNNEDVQMTVKTLNFLLKQIKN